MDIDIEATVALLTEVETQNELPQQAGFTFDNTIHNRMPGILDAIANILVSKPRGEVVAVGLQQPAGYKSTLKHARDLVADLQSLGSDFAEFRKTTVEEDNNTQANNTSVSEDESERRSSPCMNENIFPTRLRTKITAFRVKICLFTLSKIKQCLQKPFSETTRGQFFINSFETFPKNHNTRNYGSYERSTPLFVSCCTYSRCIHISDLRKKLNVL
ncbi:hypothetical protein ACJ72_04110 [Emergomyces africanus]|uniref:Uncharacterized protein n=1 Tax=Emergomyces africanus TaxID=1955775 RepID=A0A1B7NXP6_9EURO|nr:hypothetical protein ACJ72_04110 [Emergomyces africanus]